MHKKDEILSQSLIILFAFLTIAAFWWREIDYLKEGGEPIEINYADINQLNSSIGSYVLISNVCTHDSIVEYEKGLEIAEYYALVECNSSNTDSTHMFAIIENEWGILFFDHLAIENGTVDFFEGELLKSCYFDSMVKNMFNSMGIDYSEKESFILKAGKTPKRTKVKLILTTIITSIIYLSGFILVYLYYKKRRKKILDNNQLSTKQE